MANIIGAHIKRNIIARLLGMIVYQEKEVKKGDPGYGILLGNGKAVRHIYKIEYDIRDRNLKGIEPFVAKFLGVEEPKGMREYLGRSKKTDVFIAFDRFMQENVNPDLRAYCLDNCPVYAGTKPRKVDVVSALTRVLSWFDAYCLEHMRNEIYDLYTSFMASRRG